VAAANALADGKVDLVFQAAGDDSQAVQLLTRSSGIQLLGAEHAGALAAQNPRLQPLLLPQGAIELRGDIPPKDLTLMSLQTHLLVRPDAHPALQRALLDAAVEIHEIPNFLQRHGQATCGGAPRLGHRHAVGDDYEARHSPSSQLRDSRIAQRMRPTCE
jgi:hypothetical protein